MDKKRHYLLQRFLQRSAGRHHARHLANDSDGGKVPSNDFCIILNMAFHIHPPSFTETTTYDDGKKSSIFGKRDDVPCNLLPHPHEACHRYTSHRRSSSFLIEIIATSLAYGDTWLRSSIVMIMTIIMVIANLKVHAVRYYVECRGSSWARHYCHYHFHNMIIHHQSSQ